ncbi:unnamed protein product [Sphagnum jensenii]|uniref:Uncharacterized protein n=1 Tax=Sphagnum jensenii TaxID=128206 RepID=A0ABP1A973_9BRYO
MSQMGKPSPVRKDPTDVQTTKIGKVRSETRISASCPSQSNEPILEVLESLALDPTKRNSMFTNQKDQAMAERSEFPNHTKSFLQAEAECKADGNPTPKAKLSFGLLGETSKQTPALETNNNPNNSNRGLESWNKSQMDNSEG